MFEEGEVRVKKIFKRRSLLCFLTIAIVMCAGLSVYASGGYSTEYYASVKYQYYDESDRSVDIRFYKEPTVPMVFTCGSWTYTHPYYYETMAVDREPFYYFGSGIHNLSESDFKNGTDLVLESYPVPEGFEAINLPKIVQNKSDIIGDEPQVPFFIILKKKGETVPLDKLGVYVQVEKYKDGSTIWPYTGEPVCPKVQVVKTGYAGIVLKEGVDYTVSYEENIEPGHPVIVITGKGKYSGQSKFTYRYQIWDYGTAGGQGSAETKELEKGDIFSDGTNRYVVISPTYGTVAFGGPKTKKANIAVPAKVTYGGKTYKVTAIRAKAFYNNRNIKKVTIGNNVRTIGKHAFRNCRNLRTINIKSKVLKKAGAACFKGIHKKAVIKVPAKKLKAYKKLLRGKGQAKTVRFRKL